MIVKAILKAFDAGAYTADVQFIGSVVSYVEDIPVSRAIPAAEMTAGRTCAVALFSPSNFADGVVFAVFTP